MFRLPLVALISLVAIGSLLAVLLQGQSSPELNAKHSAAAAAAIDDFAGVNGWQNATWYSPISDSESRLYVYVEFDYVASGKRVGATVVLIGDRALLVLDKPAAAMHWVELLKKD
jgi:hypothetical protein